MMAAYDPIEPQFNTIECVGKMYPDVAHWIMFDELKRKERIVKFEAEQEFIAALLVGG